MTISGWLHLGWALGVAGTGVWLVLLRRGVIHSPYSGLSYRLAWRLGFPERAYNFATVVPERLWRSSRPDVRFLTYLREHYGLERVISLNGETRNAFHPAMPDLGLELVVRHWSNDFPPDPEEIDALLALLDEPVPTLVHCAAGKDRTGFAIACYRIERQGWDLEQALAEMRRHWHKPHQRPWFDEALRERYRARQSKAPAAHETAGGERRRG